jgi:hypothetical protein
MPEGVCRSSATASTPCFWLLAVAATAAAVAAIANRRTDNSRDHWTLGHIKPVVEFDLTDAQQLRECFALCNLQPEVAADNYAGGAQLRGLRGVKLTADAAATAAAAAAAPAGTSCTAACTGTISSSSSGGVDGVRAPQSQQKRTRRLWTELEEALLWERHALFEAGELGGNRDGTQAVDRAWKRIKHYDSSSYGSGAWDKQPTQDYFPGRTVAQIRDKYTDLQSKKKNLSKQ